MFNAASSFAVNTNGGGVNHQLRSDAPPIPVETTPEPVVVSTLPNPNEITEPIIPANTVNTPPAVVIETQPPITPDPVTPQTPDLDNKNTFYLLGEALKAQEYLPEDFPLEENTANAAKFVEATGTYIKKAADTAKAQAEAALREEYATIAQEIEFRRNGGSLDTLDQLAPFKQALSYDPSQIESEEDKLALKQAVIGQALFVSGTKNQEVIDLAIKGYLEKGSIDAVYEQSKQTVANFIKTTEAAEIQRVKAQRAADLKAEADKQEAYVNSIKGYISKGTIGDIKVPNTEIELINQNIFGPKTEVITQVTAEGKKQNIPVTGWEKFMHEFFHNPETQVQAFYYYLKGGAGISNLKQVASNEYALKVLETLDNRNNSMGVTSHGQTAPGAPGTFLKKLS